MANDPSPEMSAAPLEVRRVPAAVLTVQDDLWTWHFTIRVPHPGFEGGVYHGRINVRALQRHFAPAHAELSLVVCYGLFAVQSLRRSSCRTSIPSDRVRRISGTLSLTPQPT